MWLNSQTQNVIKLKKKNVTELKSIKIETKLVSLNCDKTHELELWEETFFYKKNCDKLKIKLWPYLKTQIGTKPLTQKK